MKVLTTLWSRPVNFHVVLSHPQGGEMEVI
jgi:hypothetical protein